MLAVPKTEADNLVGVRKALIAALALAATIGLSFLPYSEKMMLHTKGRLHLWGHVFVFGLLTALICWCLEERKGRAGVLLGLVLLAVGLEFGQHFVYHSPIEPLDVLADVAGILCVEVGLRLRGQLA